MDYKKIPGYPRYGISKAGEIKNLETGRTFKGGPNTKSGYYQTKLTDSEGKQKGYEIHVLMAITYLNHVPCGHKIVVDHKNTLRFDNSLENLQLITQRQNLTKDKKGTSKYPGVSFHQNKNWRAQIRINGKQKYLGVFPTEEEAHQAYQKALSDLNGID